MRLVLDDIEVDADSDRDGPAVSVLADGTMQLRSRPFTFVVSPLEPKSAEDPDPDPEAPPSLLLARDCPPGHTLHIISDEPGETAQGFSLRLVHAQLRSAAGAQDPLGTRITEERLAAIYQFLQYTATVVARFSPHAHGGTTFTAELPRLTALFRSGRPDWRAEEEGAVSTLWDIWQ